MASDETEKLDYSDEPILENFTEQQLAEPYIINLLFRSFRNLQTMIHAPLQARGHQGIGLAETRLLLALDKKGTRINTLAQRTSTSRQFTSRVVHNLEQRGYVQITPDPNDGRATLVKMEAQGWQYFRDIQEVKHALDTILMNMLGEESITNLFATLQDLIKQTDQHNPAWEQSIGPK